MKLLTRIRTNGEDVNIRLDSIGLNISTLYSFKVYEVFAYDNNNEKYFLKAVSETGLSQVLTVSSRQIMGLLETKKIVLISN